MSSHFDFFSVVQHNPEIIQYREPSNSMQNHCSQPILDTSLPNKGICMSIGKVLIQKFTHFPSNLEQIQVLGDMPI